MTQHHIPGDLNRQQQCRENIKSHIRYSITVMLHLKQVSSHLQLKDCSSDLTTLETKVNLKSVKPVSQYVN